MPHITQLLGLDTIISPWADQIILIMLLTLVIHLIVKTVFVQSEKVADKTESLWDDAVIKAVKTPAVTMIWALGAIFVLLHVNEHYKMTFDEPLRIATKLTIVVCFAWFLTRIINHFSNNLSILKTQGKIDLDATTLDALTKLMRLIVLVFATLIVVQTLGFSISALLTAGGIGGIAIGFAAKDLLANFFGGLTIYLDRPFSVGDWIRSPDKNIEGTVEYISWRHTRIRAFNKNPIYVPNALFTQIVVENPSRMTHRRIKTNIGIRYDDISKMRAVVDGIREMLKTHADIDSSQTLIVNFNDFSASSVDIFIYTFTRTVNWTQFQAVKEDVYLKIAEVVENNGAEMAFPTQTLHITNDDEQDSEA